MQREWERETAVSLSHLLFALNGKTAVRVRAVITVLRGLHAGVAFQKSLNDCATARLGSDSRRQRAAGTSDHGFVAAEFHCRTAAE